MNTEPNETALTEDQEKEQAVVLAQTAMASITNVPEYKKTLSDLVEKHKDAKFTDLEDKDGIKAITAAYSETRQARLAVDKLGKNFKGLMKQIIEHGEGQIDELLQIVSPSEKAFKVEKDRIDELKEEEKQEKARQEEEKKQQRTSELVALGATWNGSYWTIGDLSVRILDITHSSQTQWEGTISQARVIYEAEQLRIAEEEEERRKAQEAADLKAEQERAESLKEQKRLQAEADARQKELDAERQEKELMRLERTEGRVETLRRHEFTGDLKVGSMTRAGFILKAEFIVDATKAEWDAKMSEFDGYLKELNKPKALVIEPPKPVSPPLNGHVIKFTNEERENILTDVLVEVPEEAVEEPEINDNKILVVSTTINFTAATPYIDTPVGKATLRIYVEEFVEQASEGLTKENVSASGAIDDRLLFLVIKPKV